MQTAGPRCVIAVLLCLSAGCTGVQHVNPEGRPCGPTLRCGLGTTCDPVTARCVSTADLKVPAHDGRADGPSMDGRPLDGPALDGPWGDGAADASPDDLVPPPDQTPPCSGLTCPLGCQVSLNRCKRLAPSNVPPSQRSSLQAGSKAQVAGKTMVLDSSSGQLTVDGKVVRPSGSSGTSSNGVFWGGVSQSGGKPDIGVFGVESLVLQSGGTLTIKGKRAALIYASVKLTIQGAVVASASRPAAAPGGFAGGAPGASASSCFGGGGSGGTPGTGCSPACESGGGGGGRKASGGKGGVPTPDGTPGGAGGSANGSSTLVPLYGGCGGGGGGGTQGGPGGGGGGALQLSTSGTLLVSSGGVISMPGAGGEMAMLTSIQGGGGGGSGGAILLEGATVQLQGVVAANGGGGGAGQKGQDGQASSTAAKGGAEATHVGVGGKGGALAIEAGGAGVGGASKNDGGGGGGAAGRIRVNAPNKSLSGTISPSPSTSTAITTW